MNAGPPLADPLAAYSAMLSGIDGLDQLERIRRGMWIHATTPRPPVGLTPHEVIHTQDKLAVRYYAPDAPALKAPVLLVPSMINKAWILDLEPDRSLVVGLATRGHPVYLLDWGVPGPEDAHEDVGYAVEELLHRSVDRVRRHAGAAGVILFGYCMGGTLTAMYAALHPERVLGLVCLNAPARFAESGRFGDFVRGDIFDVEAAIPPDDLVPVTVMAPAFKLLDPMANWTKYLGIEAASHDPRRLARTMAHERWLEENVPISGSMAREWITCAYQRDALLEGTWALRGRRVDLGAVTAPALVVACERDFITPPRCALPMADALGSEDVEAVELSAGHIGVIVGSTGPKVFYPLLDRWIRRISGVSEDR
ncbi:MAG: alpha/beta fold hydrolase [Alphaproteobacteria bacterium]|nr:alpha/beta fold hydrolase [Alphaproteobacteria bacterium]